MTDYRYMHGINGKPHLHRNIDGSGARDVLGRELCCECVKQSGRQEYITLDEQKGVWPFYPSDPCPWNEETHPDEYRCYCNTEIAEPIEACFDDDFVGNYALYWPIVESNMCIRHLVWLRAYVPCESDNGIFKYLSGDSASLGQPLETVAPDYVMRGADFCLRRPPASWRLPGFNPDGTMKPRVEGPRPCPIMVEPVRWRCEDYNPINALHAPMPDLTPAQIAEILDIVAQGVSTKAVIHPFVLTLDMHRWFQSVHHRNREFSDGNTKDVFVSKELNYSTRTSAVDWYAVSMLNEVGYTFLVDGEMPDIEEECPCNPSRDAT